MLIEELTFLKNIFTLHFQLVVQLYCENTFFLPSQMPTHWNKVLVSF